MKITDEEFTLESLEMEDNETSPEIFSETELKSITIFHLLNGEDIFGVLVEQTDDYFIVKRPMVLIKTQNENGNTNLILTKWIIFSDTQEQLVTKSTITTYTSLTKDMRDFYIRSIVNELKKEEASALGILADFVWPTWMDEVIEANDKKQIH